VREIHESFQHEAIMSSASQTTDFVEIRRWIEERDDMPSRVGTDGNGGPLDIDFRAREVNLKPMGCHQFFSVFERAISPYSNTVNPQPAHSVVTTRS
jgi:hypothetical protein